MGDSSNAWDFFLAHAGVDSDRADALYQLLSTHARVFLDSRSLKLGDDWDATLARAQRGSLITVVLVSASTDQAYYQREEIAGALSMAREDQSKHRVVPVYLDGLTADRANIPYGLRLKHGLTAAKDDGLTFVARQLLELLGQLTGRSIVTNTGVTPSAETQREPRRAPDDLTLDLEIELSHSANSRIRRGRHPLHGVVLVKDLLMIPDESADVVSSRHYRALLGDRVIDVGRREDGTLYEILREIPGHDLSKIVHKDNVIVGALLDDVAMQIMEQLATLHGAPKPLIHRDVRPTNLILNFERTKDQARYKPVVRLIDYDTACFVNDQQTPWGAHGFTAPEQREGKAVLASDLFSLVSSLYFLATGSVPADANSWSDLEPPSFDVLWKAHSTALSEVYGHDELLRCWSYDVSQRPRSAVEFLNKRPARGTRFIPPPERLGAFTVGNEWTVELFDSHYIIKRAPAAR